MTEDDENSHVSFGTTVFDDEGNRLGTIRGFDEHGFYVTTEDGIESLSGEHRTAGLPGEGELMWRCWECGAMGDIEEIPDACPDCGAPKESLYYWTED